MTEDELLNKLKVFECGECGKISNKEYKPIETNYCQDCYNEWNEEMLLKHGEEQKTGPINEEDDSYYDNF